MKVWFLSEQNNLKKTKVNLHLKIIIPVKAFALCYSFITIYPKFIPLIYPIPKELTFQLYSYLADKRVQVIIINKILQAESPAASEVAKFQATLLRRFVKINNEAHDQLCNVSSCMTPCYSYSNKQRHWTKWAQSSRLLPSFRMLTSSSFISSKDYLIIKLIAVMAINKFRYSKMLGDVGIC